MIEYLGPADWVNVEPHGRHMKNEVKEYPDDFAEELLGTSKKQQFKKTGDSGTKETEDSSTKEPKKK